MTHRTTPIALVPGLGASDDVQHLVTDINGAVARTVAALKRRQALVYIPDVVVSADAPSALQHLATDINAAFRRVAKAINDRSDIGHALGSIVDVDAPAHIQHLATDFNDVLRLLNLEALAYGEGGYGIGVYG